MGWKHLFVQRDLVLFNWKDVLVLEELETDVITSAQYHGIEVFHFCAVGENDAIRGKMRYPRLQFDSSGGNTEGEVITDYRRGIQDPVSGKKPVRLVVKPLLSGSYSQPFFDLGREAVKEPRFHVLVPGQAALLQAGNYPGPSMRTEVNLGGVAAQFNSDIGGGVSKTCMKNNKY